jgi:hypothetical protein
MNMMRRWFMQKILLSEITGFAAVCLQIGHKRGEGWVERVKMGGKG